MAHILQNEVLGTVNRLRKLFGCCNDCLDYAGCDSKAFQGYRCVLTAEADDVLLYILRIGSPIMRELSNGMLDLSCEDSRE